MQRADDGPAETEAAAVGATDECERAFEAMMDAALILDSAGFVRRANAAFARLVGRAGEDLRRISYSSILGEVDSSEPDPIARSLATGKSYDGVAVVSSWGVDSRVRVSVSSLAGPNGLTDGLIAVFRRVGDHADRDARLALSHRLADVGRLAGGVAHEINTPLASIALRAESLQRKAADPKLLAIESFKDFPRYLKTIEEEIYRCKGIVTALLEFSRSRPPEVTTTDLNALAERAAGLVGDQMRAKQIALALELMPGLPLVPVDEAQIREAMIILLLNALDATSPGGHVLVETGLGPEGFVRLAVSDDGTGISPERLDHLFTPFFTTKPVGHGTGLGLAICDGIVGRHGGRIEVQTALGSGTRMTLLLPRTGVAAGSRREKGVNP
jgi:signal transduction histidine kinase